MASKTFIAGGTDSNWGTANNWSPVASVPAAGDDVIFGATSPSCIVNVATNNLNSLNMTGYVATLSGASNITVIGTTATTQVCKFAGTITWTGTLILSPTTATSQINVTLGGMTTATGITVSATAASPIYFLSAINLGVTRTFTFTMGTLHLDGLTDTAGLTHSMGVFSSTNTNTRSLYLGNATVNLSGTGIVLNLDTQTGLTVVQGLSAIGVTDVSATGKTLIFGVTAPVATAKTFNNLSITGGGAGTVTFNNGSTNGVVFNNFTVGAPKTVNFQSGHIFTFNGTFSAVGTATNGITLASSTTASVTLAFGSSAVVTTDYVTATYLTASGAGLPYLLGMHSTLGTGNVGFAILAYNLAVLYPTYVYQATSGGTVFSANLTASTAYAYFSNTPAVNDAIYFGYSNGSALPSNLTLTIGTAMAGTGIVLAFEYLSRSNTWLPLYNFTDGSAALTTLGVVTLKFPIQPGMSMKTATVNVNGLGTTIGWIRIRLVSFTTVTAGGANITSRISNSNGQVACFGFTSTYQCTFGKLQAYAALVAPEVEATNPINGVYRFNNCILWLGSVTTSQNEQIFLGNGADHGTIAGASGGALLDASYLIAGTASGVDGWINSSDFYLCSYQYNVVLVTTANTFVYGGSWNSWNNVVNGTTWTSIVYLYPSHGTWIGTEFRDTTGGFIDSTCNKLTVTGNLITNSIPAAYPNNMRISNAAINVWLLYNVGGTIANVNYVMPTTAVFVQNQSGGDSAIWNADNLSPTLNDYGSGIPPIAMTVGSDSAFNNAFYYTSATTTYTDVTTNINSGTLNDVPLPNVVGDCLYLRNGTVTLSNSPICLKFTLTPQTNANTYVWEFATAAGVWTQCGTVWDLTNNFTTSGRVYPQVQGNAWGAYVVNAVSGFWFRLRCTVAGGSSPTISTAYWRSNSGIGLWKLYERYSTALTVTSGGAALVGALVHIVDKTGLAISGSPFTTDVNGAIATQTIPKRYFFFDPANSSDTYWNINQYLYNPYSYSVRKYGYVFSTTSKTVSTTSVDGIVQAVNPFTVASSATAAAYTNIAITGSAKAVVLSGAHTLQELYDYNEYWAALSVNMGYAEPLATTDGLTYIFASGWTFTGVANLTLGAKYLSGGTIVLSTPGTVALNLSTTTLSFSVAGTYDLTTSNLSGTITVANTSGGPVIINALPGVTFVNSGPSIAINQTLSVNLVLTNVVIGSRYNIFASNTLAVETDTTIASGTAAASTVTIPYLYTSNVNVVIRVRNSYTTPKYDNYETISIITSSGMSVYVQQSLSLV